ncbi:MAG: hypothetical protein AAFQ22_04815 [Pseudomonadota bacterium]
MNDVVVNLGLDRPGDEQILASAIETYARWRQNLCEIDSRQASDDAPDIMVKTGFKSCGAVQKTLIFQERRWAAGFLRIWRYQRRQA